ncbi:hypothetical protein BOTCAL_0139g00080 [Botryotinia calthae]|uniref:Uncharacterized protein n=1 Tax=Botryotinia calthae TaxID=38488 RepID=A0A4Y8D5H9_9HELO|nr:hypothetical protein BOTCAL_0139g00080 [Botryotinia calthae]
MTETSPEPIVIIGSGCRLPGEASTPSKLWELLQKPRDLLQKIDRFNADGFYHKDGHYHGAANVTHAHLLSEDFRLFDAGFFGIKPVEAESIDPLQRILLETVYEGIENAGLPMEKLAGSDTAFFAGVMATDYTDILMRDPDTIPQYFATATARSIISNRVSYVFDWHGPSMTIDTACSSSFMALHSAVQSLRSGESGVAVAAGGNLILGPALSKVNMLSPKGRSAMWDADVDGYGRGEGFVAIVMKRLSDAIRDGDHIDCVIRDTGSNQDGRTKGITMPSASAQAQLIRNTYAKAGLDSRKPKDQPQYFEAHGTGTKAGDPQEAEAIYTAFFGADFNQSEQDTPLYVGGIKTVVGHTEGTAGLAGLLKSSLSLQAGVIPPNRLFNSLNPEIAPFYGPLKVPTETIPWPKLPKGVPRRASVNSFGFGGANAHAILESWTTAEDDARGADFDDVPPLIPFVFSASSEVSLQRTLFSFKEYLTNHPDTNLFDLVWSLRARRSALPIKTVISASSVVELIDTIDTKLQDVSKTPSTTIGIRSVTGQQKILGIFTGQGAQWAQMGKQLMEKLPRVKNLARGLDEALKQLSESTRPSWSIVEELSRDAKSSRLQEALYSQPLCTALQIILVDILRSAGIEFAAVVGHSSGEIGAAYAAGLISASDAIKIAYLRGFYAKLAGGATGEKGAMIAIGMSMEDAKDFCKLPQFEGRISLAASNSTSSVTLSGDRTAVNQAKEYFDENKIFARLLKVDTAYHSHHMQPCADPYISALNDAGVSVNTTSGSCIWYSSVLDGVSTDQSDPVIRTALQGTYWRDNMVNPVLFSHAITAAVTNSGPFQTVLEVGPHPALKGPASQTLSDLGVNIPYFGVLKRGEDDIRAVSECFGSLWTTLGASAINFDGAHKLLYDNDKIIPTPRLIKNLPSYSWDHDKPYWYESRRSKLYRSRAQPSHELLGVRCDEGDDHELRWRNMLTVQEIPWLQGHQIQGQTVYPAAGYVSMALEAAQIMASEENIELLEIRDLVISKAIVFYDEKTGVETITTVSGIKRHKASVNGNRSITADFTISSHLSRDQAVLTKVASGNICVSVGHASQNRKLPSGGSTPSHLLDVDIDRFYSSLEKVGYGYTDRFRSFSKMKRRLNFTTGLIEQPAETEIDNVLLVHPGLLDNAFQALFGAYFWPADGRMWTLFLPTSIQKVTIDPSRYRAAKRENENTEILEFEAWLLDSPAKEIRGDVVFSAKSGAASDAIIQVEGASMISYFETPARDDRSMFFETTWGISTPDGELAVSTERSTQEELELAETCERIAHYYWRKLEDDLTPSDRENCGEHHKHLLAAITHLLGRKLDGKQSYIKKEWRNDSEQLISALIQKYSAAVDVRLSASVGRALPAVIRKETTMLEHMRADNMLDDFYSESLGLPATNRYLGRIVKQLAHRYPRMNFIEIGAGTGSSTEAVFNGLEGAYSSYIFTDISSGFFENAAARFAKERGKITFKTLDIERPPADQGYIANSYDVIVASNVLHATSNLEKTLRNVRSLLKPGGYLLLLEITDNTSIRYSFLMGGLSGWWMGADDGRRYSPCIAPSKWHKILRTSGFSGVDTVTPTPDPFPNPFSIIATQAVDDRIQHIRHPLYKFAIGGKQNNDLYVLGGHRLETSKLIEEVLTTVGNRFEDVITIENLEDIIDTNFAPSSTVISFLDLDGPVLQDLSPVQLKSLQLLVETSHNLLWITQGQEEENPYSNAIVGFFRSVSAELPTLRAQILDFDVDEKIQSHARVIVEALLRLQETEEWEQGPVIQEQLLWTTEPELRFRDDKLWVPRVKAHQDNNNRLNGLRRVIKERANERTLLRLSDVEESWTLRRHYVPASLPSDEPLETVAIKVRYSTLWAPNLDKGGLSLKLVVGQQVDSDQLVASFTTELSSVIKVNSAWTTTVSNFANDPSILIAGLLAESLSDRIAELAKENLGFILVHEPELLLASTLLRKARVHKFKVKFLTEDPLKAGPEWIFLHPRQSIRAARLVLPQNVSTFVYFDASESHNLVDLVVACLPSNCRVVLGENFAIYKNPSLPGGSSLESIRLSIATLVENAKLLGNDTNLARDFVQTHLVSLADLQTTPTRTNPFTLVDWTTESLLPIEVSQPRPDVLFKSDKSYKLVGMTGEMGRSLCRWMVESGAGAIVLTSRNPKIDQAWIDELESMGTRIKIGAFDATNRESWMSFRSEIAEDLPPLAGIINGAVILQDQMFLDMDIDGFNQTLAPKIDSTIHLDEVFRDDILDFFIVFSSLSSIIGNRGQANYNAANAFMTSMVRQRMSRGKAASVIQLGSVVGVGFLTRAGDVMETILIKYGYMPVSEVDLHYIVSQAIMAGLPGSGENPDLITGLRYARENEEGGLHWASNPRFAHMILPPEKEEIDTWEKKAVLSTRAQLVMATSLQEAYKAMETCFGNKLMAILQMVESSFRPDAALIELGIDSLVAVEIRTWFLKEVNVDMAVLKLLGGATTIDIARSAVEQMSAELLPGITDGGLDNGTKELDENKQVMNTIIPVSGYIQDLIIPAQLSSDSAENSTTPESPNSATPTTSDGDPFPLAIKENNKPTPEIQRRVRISSAQSRFWFLNTFLADKTSSNVTFSYNIQGRLHYADLARAVKTAAQAHDSLRTCFIPSEDCLEVAWQGIMRTSKLELEQQNVLTDDEVKAAYNRVRNTVYDLEQGETMQIILLSKDAASHTIIFGYHHIVLDGIGFEAFLADLERAYTRKSVLPKGLQYSVFSEKEGHAIETDSRKKKLSYWKREFENIPTILPLLPVCKVTSRRAVSSYESSYVQLRLDASMVARIKRTCQKSHVTPSHFYLATFRIMLMRLDNVEDICIGLADANRHESDVMSTVGLFLNMLPLNFKQSLNTPFVDILKDTRVKVYDALGHAGIPFDDLLQALRLPRSSSHSPLFQAFFDYHQGAQEKLKFGETAWENVDRNPGERAYDITLDVIEGNAGSLVALIGQRYLYGIDEMQKLLETYFTLLEQFADNSLTPVNLAKLYGQKQIDDALILSRGKTHDSEWDATLGHRVQKICLQNPDAVALTDGDNFNLKYCDLALKAQAIRERLLAAGVKQGDKVAVFQEPTPNCIVSLIAIFWTGAVYVPLVPLNPIPRLAAIVIAAKPAAVLTDESTTILASQLQLSKSGIINVSLLPPAPHPKFIQIPVSAEDPALVLFTSGSTGVPKGIVLRHRNLAHHIEGYVKKWKIGREIVLQQSALSFDLSIGQIFTALSMGGTLVVVPQKTRGDPVSLATIMCKSEVTWTLLTPSEYSSLLEFGTQHLEKAIAWKHAIACGEALTRKLIQGFRKLAHLDVRLYNAYGPVEAIISATMAEISFRDFQDDVPVTIGVPNPNYSIYIVDEQCNLLPQGFPGEILIGGCGVASGYLNNTELTEEKFLINIFESSAASKKGWNVSYRTGDMGRLHKDGTFTFEGRREGDSQVKIRGFRVDLLDIESTILNTAKGVLSDAVVTMRKEAKILISNVVFARNQQPQDPEAWLSEFLRTLPLPTYMIPAVAIPVDFFPKNLHGKKDRLAIANFPLPHELTSSATDATEFSPIERRLAETWRELLPSDFVDLFKIGADTDFFSVGGNSLILVKLQSQIREIFNVSVPLLELFDVSTLSKMAAHIEVSRVVSTINWNEETAVDVQTLKNVHISHSLSTSKVETNETSKTVLFTGATGYLGSYLLAELISNQSIQTIHCIAVRASANSDAQSRIPLFSSPKVVVHAGDLSSAQLGLDQETIDYFTANVDLIIHSGARRSFWDSYYELRGTNVLSSKELVRIATPRKIPIQFLSTSGVLLLNKSIDGEREASVRDFKPPNAGQEGYVASKWASEVILENAARELDIPVRIHRFTPRTKPSEKRTSLAALEDLIESTTKLGAIPERSTWAGRFDVVRTQELAQRMITQATNDIFSKSRERGRVTFNHHPGEACLTPTELFDFLEEKLGHKIKSRLGLLEWVGGVKKCEYGWFFSTHDLELVKNENGVVTRLVNRR